MWVSDHTVSFVGFLHTDTLSNKNIFITWQNSKEWKQNKNPSFGAAVPIIRPWSSLLKILLETYCSRSSWTFCPATIIYKHSIVRLQVSKWTKQKSKIKCICFRPYCELYSSLGLLGFKWCTYNCWKYILKLLEHKAHFTTGIKKSENASAKTAPSLGTDLLPSLEPEWQRETSADKVHSSKYLFCQQCFLVDQFSLSSALVCPWFGLKEGTLYIVSGKPQRETQSKHSLLSTCPQFIWGLSSNIPSFCNGTPLSCHIPTEADPKTLLDTILSCAKKECFSCTEILIKEVKFPQIYPSAKFLFFCCVGLKYAAFPSQ